MEPIAISKYVEYQKSNGHPDLTVCASGFIVSTSHPFLGASPDGAVYDPSNSLQPFGFLEIKCPYSARDMSPLEACMNSGFCCRVDSTTECVRLKESHTYFSQVQGQMAIGCRPWCDFVLYTNKGISVEKISFNESFWNDKLLPRLISFYDNCVVPEIVSPVHALGLPVRDLSKSFS